MGDDLTLEKLKINERLMEVERHMIEAKVGREHLITAVDKLEKTIDRIDHKINGNGEPGIDDRVKSLEGAEEKRIEAHKGFMNILSGLITTAVVAFLAAIGAAIIAVLKWMKIINIT